MKCPFLLESVARRVFAFPVQLGAALIVLAGSIYFNSGTLAPYAATIIRPIVEREHGYLYNLDHDNFKAVYLMLSGAPRTLWETSMVLRRVLFYFFAYFPMKQFGFEMGGLLTSVILHGVCVGGFVLFVRKRIGPSAGVVSLWLLALYPGVPYFATLPYSYVTIVPFALLLTILLIVLKDSGRPGTAVLCALAMGVLFLAYDFYVFYLPALVLLLWRHRKFGVPLKIGCALLTLLPLSLWLLALKEIYRVPFSNPNTDIFGVILSSYFKSWRLYFVFMPAWNSVVWVKLVQLLPFYFFHTFFYNVFGWLSLLGFVSGWAAWKVLKKRDLSVEGAIFLSAVAFFLFNNLAPPYNGWPMRGDVIARLYEPIFPVYILLAAKTLERLIQAGARLRARILVGLAIAVVILNGAICFAPYLGDPAIGLANKFYGEFYHHDNPDAYLINVHLRPKKLLGM